MLSFNKEESHNLNLIKERELKENLPQQNLILEDIIWGTGSKLTTARQEISIFKYSHL